MSVITELASRAFLAENKQQELEAIEREYDGGLTPGHHEPEDLAYTFTFINWCTSEPADAHATAQALFRDSKALWMKPELDYGQLIELRTKWNLLKLLQWNVSNCGAISRAAICLVRADEELKKVEATM